MNSSNWFDKQPNRTLLKRIQEMISGKNANTAHLHVPNILSACSGIFLKGKIVRSILFSTDMAIIENCNADAVLAVYPFSPSATLIKDIIRFARRPVICGIGGGLTKGRKSLEMALHAEACGASAIIVNQPFPEKDIALIKKRIRIPFIATIANSAINLKNKINAGVDIINISAGAQTPDMIREVVQTYRIPIIATGGRTLNSINDVAIAGAYSVVLTPPSTSDIFKKIMTRYRNGLKY